MLEMRSTCEKCGVELPVDSKKAFICSYECTFCADCAENAFHYICPNCDGVLTPRPTRTETS